MRSGGPALVLWIVTGCLQSKVVVCASGRVCPEGYACDDIADRCIAPEQSRPCEGLAEGDSCFFGGAPGACTGGLCTPRFCGDGVRSGEICDGTDLGGETCATRGFYGETTGLACTPNCTFDDSGCVGACGDGERNGGELCDGQDIGAATCIDAGFYEPVGLGCSPFCTYDVSMCSERCGDAITNGPELCDGAPPVESCIDTGLDAGTLDCNLACAYDLGGCARFGWRFETTFPVFGSFAAIHGSGPDDIWLVGDAGSAYHFDGSTWTISTTGTSTGFSGVWTNGPSDAWVVDYNAAVRHWNGTSWTPVASAPAGATAVWATASNDVWITTANNGVKRWNGTAWSDVGGVTQTGLTMIHGLGPSDVWISTFGGDALHWNGSAWTARPLGVSGAYVTRMFASGPDEVWLAGASPGELPFRAHWKAGWTSEEVAANLGSAYRSLTGTGPNDLWLLNDEGIAEHYDGGAWLPVPVPMDELVFAIAPSNVIGTSARAMYRFSGQAYVTLPPAPIFLSGDMYVSRNGHLFMPAQGTGNPVAHWDGLAWTSPAASSGAVTAVWGTSETDVWGASASGKPTHFNGTTWTETTIANTVGLRSVWGSGASDVWFGGSGGVVLHYDGQNWTNRNISGLSGSNFIATISGSGPSDVWAMAGSGLLFHWTGTWAAVTTPGTGGVTSMVAVAPGQVIIFQGERAYHLSGGTWTEKPLPNAEWRPFTLAASGPNDVFGVAQTNLIYHFDGDYWSLVRTPADTALHAAARLAVTARRVDIFFVGPSRILRTLLRTQPWRCAATEAGACVDAIDNDCDGAIDELDPDC